MSYIFHGLESLRGFPIILLNVFHVFLPANCVFLLIVGSASAEAVSVIASASLATVDLNVSLSLS